MEDLMPQPATILIDDIIRLRKIKKVDYDIALPWYQDMEVLKGTAGPERKEPYDRTTVVDMYEYLANIGECYIIEVLEMSSWIPIGDVTLSETTMPIVIGNKGYWGKGIGKHVIKALLVRAKQLGFKKITLKDIYYNNKRSLRLFKSCGFQQIGTTKHGVVLELDKI